MKIIQICAAYKPAYVYGGPTMSVSKLSEELVKAGEDVMVLTTTANGKEELDVPAGKETLVDGVKVYYFKRLTKDHTHFSPSLLSFLHQTIKSAKRQTPNAKRNTLNPQLVIHIHAWWNLVSLFAALVAKWHGVKVILSPRGMLNEYTLSNNNSFSKRLIHFFLGRNLLKYVYVHSTSKVESEDVRKFLNKESEIIPNFVKMSPFSSSKNKKRDGFNLIFLGRINEIKGLENLFAALANVEINWHLNIAGEGDPFYVENLRNLTSSYQISDRISWLGHLNDERKFQWLASADLLILPSFKENFANVVIEALSCGTPVLVSHNVGLADYVNRTGLGWVSDNTPATFAEAVSQSFLEKEKRSFIRKEGPKIIRRDFEESRLAAAYVKLYQNSLK